MIEMAVGQKHGDGLVIEESMAVRSSRFPFDNIPHAPVPAVQDQFRSIIEFNEDRG
jgi:hypothetical protein